MRSPLLGRLLLLVALSSGAVEAAHAAPMSLRRVQRQGLPIGRSLEIRIGRFDDVVVLDDELLLVEESFPDEGIIRVQARRPGSPALLVLRGGESSTLVLSVAEPTEAVPFDALQFVPRDSIPVYSLAYWGSAGGALGSSLVTSSQLDAQLLYTSESKGIEASGQMLAVRSGEQTFLRDLKAEVDTDRFGLEVGDHTVRLGSGLPSYRMRGAAARVRFAGQSDLVGSLGVSSPNSCCDAFRPDGDGLARIGIQSRAGGHRMQLSVGTLVPRIQPEFLTVASATHSYESSGFRSTLAAARVGEGWVLSSGLAGGGNGRTWTFSAFHEGEGVRNSGGSADLASTRVLVSGRQRLAGSTSLTGLLQARAEGAFADETYLDGSAMFARGTRARVSLGYQPSIPVRGGAIDGDAVRHTGLLTTSLAGRGGVSSSGSAVVTYRQDGEVSGFFDVSTHRPLGPSLWIRPSGRLMVGTSNRLFGQVLGGAEARLWRWQALLSLQTSLGRSAGVAGLLSNQLTWRVSRNLSLLTLAQFDSSLSGKASPRAQIQVGIDLSGALIGNGGTVFSGGRVSGSAFLDVNHNGVRDDGEVGVEGVEVEILDKGERSGAGGSFSFRGLPPGEFEVRVDAAGYLPVQDQRVAVYRSRASTLDIALVEKKRVEIMVFADLDGDGERGLGEWEVETDLIEIQGPEGRSTYSAPDGRIRLDDPVPGSYVATVNPALLAEGYLLQDREQKRFTVRDDGFQRVSFAVSVVRKVEGQVCIDANRNGRHDGADICRAGIEIELGDRRVTTLDEGRYVFTEVDPGDYTIMAQGTPSEPFRVGARPEFRRVDLLLPVESVAQTAPQVTPTSEKKVADVAALRIRLPDPDLKVGERVALRATATYTDLAQSPVKPRWTVDDPTVVKLDGDKLLALDQGRTFLRANYKGVDAPPIEVIVRNLPVVGLTASPYDIQLDLGGVQAMSVRGIYVNGDADDVTEQIRWTTSNPDVARVEGNGVVVARGPGTAILRGTFFGVSTAPVTVKVGTGDALPTRLTSSPPTLTLGLESTGRIYADGELATGAQVHLTSEVRWETDSPEVLDVLPGGRIRPKSVGTARVWSTYRGVRSTSSQVEVVAGVGLVVIPTLGMVPVGATVPVKAFQILEDGSFAEVTKVKWLSSDEDVATLEEGRITIHRPGTAAIAAKYKGTESLPVEVVGTPAALEELEVSVDRVLLQVGENGYLDSLARFTDGQVSTATSVTSWVSSKPEIVSVSPDGELRGLEPGRALVQGRWLGEQTKVVEVVVDRGAAEVPSAVLVEPASITLSAQGSQALAASMVAESGRVMPTGSVTWEIADPSVAWVDDGVISAISVGQTELVAKVGDVESLPVPVVVEPIVGVTATPAVGRLPVGARVDLKALAVVADGSIEDLSDTGSVTWSSSDEEILKIDANGRLLAFSAGEAEIVGRWRNMETLPIAVQVADVDLDALLIDPEVAAIRVNETLPLAVVAVFTDGGRTDAMPHVTWTSTRPDVLSVDEGGVLEGLEPGVAEVFASWMGVQSARMRVTVAVANAVGVVLGNVSEVLPLGARSSLRSTAVTDDGKLLEASEQTTWRVSDPSIVRVDANGILEAVGVGRAELIAQVGDAESPPLTLEVTDADVLRLDIRPAALAVDVGDPVDLRVQAKLADGRVVDVTPLVKWEIDGKGVTADRWNTLLVAPGARAKIRASLLGLRSDWASLVTNE